MKNALLLLTGFVLATQSAHAVINAGTRGEGIRTADQSPFLNALGGTTAGKALFQMANPGAVRYLRINADNTVSALDATAFLAAIGGGSGGSGDPLPPQAGQGGKFLKTDGSVTSWDTPAGGGGPVAFADLAGSPTTNASFHALENVFYATDYGVLADGSTDDTVAIQSCIDAAAAVATNRNRAKVVLPSGVIMVRRTSLPNTHSAPEWKAGVIIRSNMSIIGQGRDVTTLRTIVGSPVDTPVLDAIDEYRAGTSMTSGSKILTVTTTAGLCAGMKVSGTGIVFNSTVVSVDSPTQLTIDNNAGATGSNAVRFGPVNIDFIGMTADSDTWLRGASRGEGEGINVKGGRNILFKNVGVKNAEQDGIDLDGGSSFLLDDVIVEDCWGSGLHIVADGAHDTILTNSVFRRNGFGRRDNGGGTGQLENGSGLDYMVTRLMVTNCRFENNAVEVNHLQGTARFVGCVFRHYPSSTLYPAWNGMAAIIVGWEGLAPVATGSFVISDSDLYSNGANNILFEVRQAWPHAVIQNSRVEGICKIVSGQTVEFIDNFHNPGGGTFIAIHVAASSGLTRVKGCRFISYLNGIRIESASGGEITSNTFQGDDGSRDVFFTPTGTHTGWNISNNVISSNANPSVYLGAGASSNSIMNNTAISKNGFSLALGGGGSSQNNVVAGNKILNLSIDSGASTGNVIENNSISGVITHPGATKYKDNTWRNNTGAGCDGIFYGTTTLAAGTSTVASIAMQKSMMVTMSLNTLGGTIASLPYVATITDGVGSTMGGGGGSNTSTYNWRISE